MEKGIGKVISAMSWGNIEQNDTGLYTTQYAWLNGLFWRLKMQMLPGYTFVDMAFISPVYHMKGERICFNETYL